ncbi:hypothetical protein R1sor_009091 [Riccia sorocarpa]|uniref:DDE Tnp4 domain-containing protein n=1 Tax=Riccia sorocarpa TaxID=122646 RepID=A0ABD3H7L9_9MARC
MPKRVFKHIVQILAPMVTKADTQFRRAVPPDVSIAAVLFRLATGGTYFHVSERFGVGLATVQEFMPEVVFAIIRYLGPMYLKWPTASEMRRVSRKLKRKSGLPNIQGAIDGTFIRVRVPQREADCYFNRKWFASLVLQGVADTDGCFLDISCGLRGSVYHRRVLRRSRFLEKVENGSILSEPVITINDGFQLSPYILGDSGKIDNLLSPHILGVDARLELLVREVLLSVKHYVNIIWRMNQ